MTNSEQALERVADGQVIGLGSGRAATAFVQVLGDRVRKGLRIRGVPTSKATATLAKELGIPLATLDEVERVDLTVDGADEVDADLNLIKGYGGALVREKIVAAASQMRVILVGAEKLVKQLGQRGKLPLEVVPFARTFCQRRLFEIGYNSTVRLQHGAPQITDNGNQLLDVQIPRLDHPQALEQTLIEIPGIVGTGLFLNMADLVFVQEAATVRVMQRSTGA